MQRLPRLPKLERVDACIVATFTTISTESQPLIDGSRLELQAKQFCGENFYLFCSGWLTVGWTQDRQAAERIFQAAKHEEFERILRLTQ